MPTDRREKRIEVATKKKQGQEVRRRAEPTDGSTKRDKAQIETTCVRNSKIMDYNYCLYETISGPIPVTFMIMTAERLILT